MESTAIQDKDTLPQPAQPKKYSIWLVLVGVALVGMYADEILIAFAGQDTTNPQSASGVLFWTALFFALLWKRRGKSGWTGVAIGIGIAFVVLIACGGIRGFVQGRSIPYQLGKAAAAINNSEHKQTSAGVRLDKAEAGPGSRMTYYMTLVNLTASEVDKSSLAASVEQDKGRTCGVPNVKKLLDQNVTVGIKYFANDGVLVESFEISRAVCDQLAVKSGASSK
jgi:hypothetical protein